VQVFESAQHRCVRQRAAITIASLAQQAADAASATAIDRMIVNRRQAMIVIDGESPRSPRGDLADGAPPALSVEDRLILLRRQCEVGFNVAGVGAGGNLFATFSSVRRTPGAGAVNDGALGFGWAVFASTNICHQSRLIRAWGEKYGGTGGTGGLW
jgi:hypothetical protein